MNRDIFQVEYWQDLAKGYTDKRPTLIEAAKFVCGLFSKINGLQDEVLQLQKDLVLKDQAFDNFIDEINLDFSKRVNQHIIGRLNPKNAPQEKQAV